VFAGANRLPRDGRAATPTSDSRSRTSPPLSHMKTVSPPQWPMVGPCPGNADQWVLKGAGALLAQLATARQSEDIDVPFDVSDADVTASGSMVARIALCPR
jgi:hypothetical protein